MICRCSTFACFIGTLPSSSAIITGAQTVRSTVQPVPQGSQLLGYTTFLHFHFILGSPKQKCKIFPETAQTDTVQRVPVCRLCQEPPSYTCYPPTYVCNKTINHSATCPQASSKSPTQKSHESPLQPLPRSSPSTEDASKLQIIPATAQLPLALSAGITAEVCKESDPPSPSEPSDSVADIKDEPTTPKTPAQFSSRAAASPPARSTSPRRDFEAEARHRKQQMPFIPKLLPRKQASPVAASPSGR